MLDINGIDTMVQVVHNRPLTSAPDRPPYLKATLPMLLLAISPLLCCGEDTLSQCQAVLLYTKAMLTLYWDLKVMAILQWWPPCIQHVDRRWDLLEAAFHLVVTQVDISQEDPVVLVILVDAFQVVLAVQVALVDIIQEVQVAILVVHLPVVPIRHLEEDPLQGTTQLVDQDLLCLHPRPFA